MRVYCWLARLVVLEGGKKFIGVVGVGFCIDLEGETGGGGVGRSTRGRRRGLIAFL